MSAHEIPNLKTLLGSRGERAPRGRGRGRGYLGASREGKEALSDIAVRGTDQDAAGSRVSCVELGYLHDPYAEMFATQKSTRRLPLLNRGTYVRTSAIDQLVNQFITTSPETSKQIVSLGAGTDTRYFRLRDQFPHTHIVYHELDFTSNTAAKLTSIKRHPQLHTKLDSAAVQQFAALGEGVTEYHSSTYNVHALDLRSLATSDDSQPVSLQNLDPRMPTLILSEMCLIYLQASTVSKILSTFIDKLVAAPTPVSLVLYEPILPGDAFGRTMISNLASRNIHLPTLSAYPGLTDQRTRLKKYGLSSGSCAADTSFIWREWVSEKEKERVGGLEMLDELEELELLLRHYCVAWGWRDEANGLFTRAWANVKEQDDG